MHKSDFSPYISATLALLWKYRMGEAEKKIRERQRERENNASLSIRLSEGVKFHGERDATTKMLGVYGTKIFPEHLLQRGWKRDVRISSTRSWVMRSDDPPKPWAGERWWEIYFKPNCFSSRLFSMWETFWILINLASILGFYYTGWCYLFLVLEKKREKKKEREIVLLSEFIYAIDLFMHKSLTKPCYTLFLTLQTLINEIGWPSIPWAGERWWDIYFTPNCFRSKLFSMWERFWILINLAFILGFLLCRIMRLISGYWEEKGEK